MSNVTTASVVTLREVTQDTLPDILRLNVGEKQQNMVASNAVSIAEAYFEPRAWFRGIYADETAVGFMMTYEDPEREPPYFYLWRLMIDYRYQGCGFGRRAVELLVERIRRVAGVEELLVSIVPGEGGAIPFYEKLGFEDTGRVDDGEKVFKLRFSS